MKRLLSTVIIACLAWVWVSKPVFSQPVIIGFDTELLSLNLTGGPFPMPLASDPGNLLGDSIDGFGFVNSSVLVTLSSSQRSLGHACAFLGGTEFLNNRLAVGNSRGCNNGNLPPIDPDALHGQSFFVDSFFDVFFDITVTDVDSTPGRDYAGQSDGASIPLPNNGPANMRSFYTVIFDKNVPNFGLVPPPEANPYIGHFLIEIPLGGDINGNGENDKLKFTLAAHQVGDENRTFIILPDGTVQDNFNSAAALAGAIVDESTDPPFTIGTFTDPGCNDGDPNTPCNPTLGFTPGVFGPTTASSILLNQVVPEPSTFLLLGAGLGLLGLGRRRMRK